VLDEATSAVDNETEAAIQRSLAHITKGRTTLMIAHRLSTIRHADLIVVMEAGRIAERGTHEELVAKGGIYGRLWAVQTGERIP
jgi:ATP-binding cassette subfamily B protein